MFQHKLRLAMFTLFVGIFMISCNLIAQQPQVPVNSADALYTQAAQTVQVQLTQQALSTPAATIPGSPFPLIPTAIPPTSTLVPASPTPLFTATATLPLPTPLPPTATAIPVICDEVKFVQDVTVADGTTYSPGAEFTKIWRLRNNGSCTWNSNYSLVFVSGERMGAPKSVQLPGNVRPGESVDVQVDFLAPAEQGRYRSYWMLSNADGERFGFGDNAENAFWVEIRVASPNQNFAYDFAVNLCTATWRSSAGSLPCPGDPNSDDGSVVLVDRPVLENGRREDESTLWTRPEETRDGWIQGVYPPYKVRAGDHFLAEVGCLDGNKNCQVVFSLDYQVSDGRVKNLGEWYEVYDEATTQINVDLSELESKSVQFIVSVTNYGKPSQANAFWLVPSVRQIKVTPTPVVYDPPIEVARRRVAQDIGLDVNEVIVVSFELTEWQDSCLGVKLPDQVCTAAITPGYKVNMIAKGKSYEAHTNMDASVVYWFRI
jgi:Ig-like domain from next to BRCA1 gene